MNIKINILFDAAEYKLIIRSLPLAQYSLERIFE